MADFVKTLKDDKFKHKVQTMSKYRQLSGDEDEVAVEIVENVIDHN
jgi:hypothetical protein